jgi:deazaflavin-dependent oxidoreductase (nitroreductase family)
VKDSTAKRLSTLHRVVFRLTRGRIGHRLVHNDMLLLTTTGRRSGTAHTVPLLFLTEGDTVVVIASWGGRPHHPEWYLNLVADPEVTIQIDGRKRRMRARTAGADERAAWWPRIVDAYDGYREYQSRTDREIPVVMLEPA